MSSFPASPSPSNGKGKGGFDGNEDELWEAAFAKMDDKCHCFKSSPAPKKTPRKFSRDVISNLNTTLVQFYWRREFLGMCLVIAGCITASLVFTNLRDLTLAHGTVYISQACALDQKEKCFPILNEDNPSYLRTGSGSKVLVPPW